MKLKYQNGNVSSVRNDLGRELIRAGIAVEIKKDPPKADLTPRWSVEIINTHGTYPVLAIVLRIGTGVISYTGRPDDVNAVKSWPGGKRFANFSHECPPSIVLLYEARWDANEQLRGEEVERIRRSAPLD